MHRPDPPQNRDRPRLRMQRRHNAASPSNSYAENPTPNVASLPPAPTHPPGHEPTESDGKHTSDSQVPTEERKHKNNVTFELLFESKGLTTIY